MPEVSTFRLHLLRATYLLIAVGLGSMVWPNLLRHAPVTGVMHGVARCLLAAVAALAVLGIRYPLKMLPLLFFELAWKSLWLVAIGLPLWSAHQINAEVWETAKANLMGLALFPIAIPWPYVLAAYLRAPADRWR